MVQTSDLRPVADALAAQRTRILDRWLNMATRQPFHRERPDLTVADHIPELLDAVVALMRRPDALDGDQGGRSMTPRSPRPRRPTPRPASTRAWVRPRS